MNTENWQDKTVLITGALGGLGSSLAKQLGKRGATIILLDQKISRLEKLYDDILATGAPEPAIYPLSLEGASPRDYETLAQTIDENFSKLDILLHCAVRFPGLRKLDQLTHEEWLKSFQVNVNGPIWLSQALVPVLLKSKDHGTAVFTLENMERVRKAFWGSYGVGKHALFAYQQMMAQEYEKSGLKVLAFNPGPMRTSLRADAYMGENPALVPQPDKAARSLIENMLEKRQQLATGFILDLENQE